MARKDEKEKKPRGRLWKTQDDLSAINNTHESWHDRQKEIIFPAKIQFLLKMLSKMQK
jgi:hypothetical protein